MSAALVYADPPGRHSIALVSPRAWIEVWDSDVHPGEHRTEWHSPKIVASVGHVDEPVLLERMPWRVAVRRLLEDQGLDVVADVTARLEERWRP